MEVSGLVAVWNFFQPTNDGMTDALKISHNPPSPTHTQSKDFVWKVHCMVWDPTCVNSKNGGSNSSTISSRHLVSLNLRIISTDQPQGNKQGDQHDIFEDELRLDWGTSKYYGRRNYQMC